MRIIVCAVCGAARAARVVRRASSAVSLRRRRSQVSSLSSAVGPGNLTLGARSVPALACVWLVLMLLVLPVN